MDSSRHQHPAGQARLAGWLTACSYLAAAALFGPPVVIAAVPFWSEAFLNHAIDQFAIRLLLAAVTISVVGFVAGLLAYLLARRSRSATGSALVAIGLNTIPLLWSLGAAWYLRIAG